MGSPNEPLSYRSAQTQGERRTGRNFGVGLLVGLAANGVPWAAGAAGVPGRVVLAMVVTLVFGAVGAAVVVSVGKRHPGFAAGLLLMVCLSCLVYGGLCFYAIQNI